jgi:TPR repeat protein
MSLQLPKEALEQLKRSAEIDDDPHAQYVIAQCYSDGSGLKINHKKAFELYKRSAEQGNVYA